jgi:hypothetical protein
MSDCAFPHDADRAGYCEGCGLAIGPAPDPAPDDAPEATVPCSNCGEPRDGGRFCERCGHRYDTEPSSVEDPRSVWVAVVAVDRELFDTTSAVARGFELPDAAERRVELIGSTIRIGRQSRRHPTAPEIDLSGAPADPGVSREHAQLLRQTDGSWVLVDAGSANGTYLNGSAERVPRNQLVPLVAGDRIRLGIWTSITLHAATGS